MKKIAYSTLAFVLFTTCIITSCKKDSLGTEAVTPSTNNASVEAASVTYPSCTPAHGQMCTPGGFGCLLRNEPEATGDRSITYYTPVLTSSGSTGVQMLIEFGNEFPDLDHGILGADEEGADETIEVANEIAAALNCSSIRVINKKYYAMKDAAHPYGFVYVDCYVEF